MWLEDDAEFEPGLIDGTVSDEAGWIGPVSSDSGMVVVRLTNASFSSVCSAWARIRETTAAPVVLASTHERALEIIASGILQEHAIDVPPDLASFPD